jgi:L-asparagine oxygenase
MEPWIDYRTARPFDYSRERHRPLADDCRIALADEERQLLLEGALNWGTMSPYDRRDAETFIRTAQQVAKAAVAPATRRAIRRVLDDGFGAVLLKNLPTDPELPPTPTAGGLLPVDYKKTHVSEFMLAALGALVNAEVFNFRQEGNGSAPLFDNVVPVRSKARQRGAGGYANNFPFHCESAWHRMRPDYLALVGVRRDAGARTLVTSVTSIEQAGLADTMPGDGYRLKPPDLYTQMRSKGIPFGTPTYRSQPPVQTSAAATINVNFNGMACRDPSAVGWLAELEDFVEANAAGCVLGPGDALIMNNSRVCHTRTGYVPEFGPEARWFVRGNFKRDLWADHPDLDEYLSEAEIRALTDQGWLAEDNRLTGRFIRFVEQPTTLATLPDPARQLVEKALNLTPVTGSRIV